MHVDRSKLFKSQALWAGAYKNRIDKPGQMEWLQFSITQIGSKQVKVQKKSISETK